MTRAWGFCIIKVMKTVSRLILPEGLEIDLLFDNGKLGYTFVHDEKNYGNAIKLPSRSVNDIASACLILFTNAIETKKALK